jgi:hypothetical protein
VLQTRIWQLTETTSLTSSIPTTITQNYETVASVIRNAHSNQVSALSVLKTVTDVQQSTVLINNVIQAQATINYYNILASAVTETNTASKAELITQAAQASAIMDSLFRESVYYNGNYPSLGGNIAMMSVFIVFLIIQMISGVFYKQWWFTVCWFCGLGLEAIGYAGRVWSSQNIGNFTAFVMQSTCLTIGPSFLMAGIYYLIAQLTLIYGLKFSILKPMQYSWIFITSDLISIFLQGAGGGVAAASGSQTGTDLMIAGLVFQVVAIAVFQFFWYHFIWKIYKSHKTFGGSEFNPEFQKIRDRNYLVPFMASVSLSVILIFVRSIYRVAELSDGWDSKLATTEIYVMILDGLMISLACLFLTILTPGFVYGKHPHLYIKKASRSSSDDNKEETHEEFNLKGFYVRTCV